MKILLIPRPNINELTITIQIHENSNNPQNSYTERWNNLGMDGNSRVEKVYYSTTIKNRTGEFE
jgi:hypothetical protein